MKTAEEYANKIKRGDINVDIKQKQKIKVEKKIDEFFHVNNFTEEKLKVFENIFNRTFDSTTICR